MGSFQPFEMLVKHARRFFLAGRFSRQGAVFRPPWALAESLFLELCSRCHACIEACPTGLLQLGDGGFPEAGFSSGHGPAYSGPGCTFCGDCVRGCVPGALQQAEAGLPPWQQQVEFGAACLAAAGVVCRTCGEHCDEGAIRFALKPGGVARPVLAEERCTGCGACMGACPSQAVTMILRSPEPVHARGSESSLARHVEPVE